MKLRLVVGLLAGMTACGAFRSDNVDPAGAIDGGTGADAMDTGSDAGADTSSPPPGAPGPAADFATGQQTPADIVVDAASVYWLNRASGGNLGSVMKAAKSGGAPVVLNDMIPAPYDMAADATHLYFTANDDQPQYSGLLLYRQDKAGGPPEQQLIDHNGTIAGCTVHAGAVFFAEQLQGGTNPIASVDGNAPSWGAVPVVAITGTFPATTVLAADATYVYAASSGSILRIAIGDGTSTVFATTTGIAKAIVLDPDTSNLYWADASAVHRLATSAPGMAPVDVAIDQPGPSAIAFDATTVYWTNVGTTATNGSVRWAPKAGGIPQTISASESEPFGIAVDDSGVYWTNHGDGRIRVARK